MCKSALWKEVLGMGNIHHRYRSLAYDSIQSVSYRKKNMDSYYIIDNVEIAFMTISFHISFQIKLIWLLFHFKLSNDT